MSKPTPLSRLDEFRPAEKGRAAPAPLAAVPPPPREEPPQQITAPPPLPAFQPVPALIQPGEGRTPRIQLGLRLDRERHDQLRRISYQLRLPTQFIIERLLCNWMDNHERRGGGE